VARLTGNLGTDFLDGLRDQADMVRLLSDYVPLKKAGRSWKGLCPFHKEKTPSFHVDEVKGLFYCFGCREGGDLFAFMMKMEGLSFPEAVRAVAERCGVDLPTEARASGGEEDVRSRLLEANSRAAAWYHRNLWSTVGERACAYLQDRGLDRETLETFGVGYAPPGWEGLMRALGRDFRPQELEAAGLVVARRQGGGHYDRFRDRILFPIRNLRGQVLGFGGRIMPGEREREEPKYLNTPETAVYRKGRVLYGLEVARAHARETGEAILVEGYTDVISLHQHGIGGAAGVCGTALTAEQAGLLARFARTVYVNFDADAAGRSAALRGLELLLETGLDVRAVLLPQGEDPASFLDREGAEAYRERLDAATDLLAFFLDGAATRGDLRSPRGKVAVIEEVLPLVARVPDRILRSEFASRLAERLQIDDGVVLERVRRALAAGRDRLEEPGPGREPAREMGLTWAERGLLQGLLDGKAREQLDSLAPEDVEGLEGEAIFLEILALRNEGNEPTCARLLDRLGRGRTGTLLGQLVTGEEEESDPGDCLDTLRKMQIERQLRRVQHRIDAAERAGDADEVDRLAMRKLELKRHLRAV